jgi:fumarylpyruvate hydrolase
MIYGFPDAPGRRTGAGACLEHRQMSSHVFPPPDAVSIPVHGSDQRFPVRRIYCVGRNYVEHAKEMGFTGREPPFFFMKPADALVYVPDGETGSIRYPLGTKSLHHEIELVVAIGKGGEKIAADKAREHVFGYAIGLDMTRRDLQGEAKKSGRPWEIGKAFDQSAPIGPIHPQTRTGWFDKGEIALQVNGKVTQQSTIDKLIWNVAETIEHLSSYWMLAPGDLIFSGTPEGVAAVEAGDLMVGSVSGLGELKVKVV